MTRLMWNVAGERTFEAGVDRGVLFIEGSDGVPWNGLVAVTENPSGGEVTSYYLDGLNYLNHVALEEFAGTIDAYTYPEEFAQCDGTRPVKNGLFATQQKRKTFGLAYRTLVGNDVNGLDHGYKIHLLYNVVAKPTTRSNNTLSNSIDPFNFSWSIFTKPPSIIGHKPTAHYVIDSQDTPAVLLEQVEDILYGSATSPPRLPSVAELFFIFGEYQSTTYDAGTLVEEYFATVDSGHISETQTETTDGGRP